MSRQKKIWAYVARISFEVNHAEEKDDRYAVGNTLFFYKLSMFPWLKCYIALVGGMYVLPLPQYNVRGAYLRAVSH